MAWTRITHAHVRQYFARQRATDRLGITIHLGFAAAYLFLAGWPTTWVAWSALPLLICLLVRMTGHLYILEALCWDHVTRLSVALAAWIGLSSLWSSGGNKDMVSDATGMLFALAIPILFPVLDQRRLLLRVLVLGIACGQLSQLVHLAGIKFNIQQLQWHRFSDRVSGWWDPVVGGSVLCAALGVWCGGLLGAIRDPGRAWARRAVCSTGIVVTLGCILLTGTRGAWIAAGLTLAASAVLLVIRTGRIAMWKVAALLLVMGAVAVASVWFTPALRGRAEKGLNEVQAAVQGRQFSSDTGARLAMWIWAGKAAAHSPVWGVGAGGYQPWCLKQIEHAKAMGEKALPAPHRHAHSWPLHTLATLGLVGLGVMGAIVVIVIRGGLRAGDPISLSVALGVLALVFAGLFDTVYVNQQTGNVLWILVALGLPMRPPLAGIPEAEAP